MLDFATVLRSAPFRVLVGKDRISLTIPRSLARNISVPLHALMNNEHMREAKEGFATLGDVEEDTFVGFCEYAYTGDYLSRMTVRTPEIEDPQPQETDPTDIPAEEVPAEDAPAEEAPAEEIRELTFEHDWNFGARVRTPVSKTEQLWSDFKNLKYEDKSPDIGDEKSGVANKGLTSATTVSLLYHVKLYLFAEKYLIDNLRILCLRKLHANLRDFELTVQTSEEILELLEFAYASTVRQESGENELRKLIVHYAACKTEILKQNTNLQSVLEANGEMACDLFFFVV